MCTMLYIKIGPCVLQSTLQNNLDICILITLPPLGYYMLQTIIPFLFSVSARQ